MVGRPIGGTKLNEPWDAHWAKRYRLQDRDKHLMAMLAMCRYLTTEQIRRLCYPGRTETPVEKRLRQLGGIGKFGFPSPMLERRVCRTWDSILDAWKLTRRGYVNANNLIPTLTMPPDQAEIADAFLEHTLVLNNLFVSLAEAPQLKALANRKDALPRRRLRSAMDGLYANAKGLPFQWVASEASRLPWHEHQGATMFNRVICPDATLVLPSLKKRVFLECEMGTHPIVSRYGDKPGSTVAKMERYHQFCVRLKDTCQRTTFYAAQFPDGFKPEVLYLVHSKARADHVNEAIDAFVRTSQEPGPYQVAKTWPEAAKDILTALGEWAPELERPRSPNLPGPRVLTPFEVKALGSFYREAVDTIRAEQRAAEKRNSPPPPFPKNKLFVAGLLHNLEQSLNPAQNV